MAFRRLAVLLCLGRSAAFLGQIRRDWAALNMRSTTRHLMRPLSPAGREECLAIETELLAEDAFVVDAFAAACEKHSTDVETSVRGGLLGEMLPQGRVRSAVLDKACFTAPLGRVAGPLESEYGWHLVLVESRVGCRFDDGMSKVVPQRALDGRVTSALVPADPADTASVAYPIFSAATLTAVALTLGSAVAELAGLVEPLDLATLAQDLGVD